MTFLRFKRLVRKFNLLTIITRCDREMNRAYRMIDLERRTGVEVIGRLHTDREWWSGKRY